MLSILKCLLCIADQTTPRTRIPLSQHTPAQLNKLVSVHGSFSNSGTLPTGNSAPTPHNTPNEKRVIKSNTGTTTQITQPNLARSSSRGQNTQKQLVPARSLSDTVDNIFELVSQQSNGTVPSHSNSVFSGPITAPNPALLYKKGSAGSGHGPLLRTRGSTQSGSLPMPDMMMPSPQLCMHEDLAGKTPRASDAQHASYTTGLCISNSTPRAGFQVWLF